MILDQDIEISIVPRTYSYWKEKGYDVTTNTNAVVKVIDLPVKSNILIQCSCDECGFRYQQRFSRNTDICGSCRTRDRMTGNSFGSVNKKYDTPPKTELLSLFDDGMNKRDVAQKYGVTSTVLNAWLKELDIVLPKNYGRLYYKDDEVRQADVANLQEAIKTISNISEVSRLTGVPRHIIRKLKIENEIDIKSQTDVWRETYGDIVTNLKDYVAKNETKSLKQISIEDNISIEQLKKAFIENGLEVKLHSYNKSKGEIECRDFINSLGIDCYSANIDKTYEIDCYVKDKNFGLEYCGEYWHRYEPAKNNKRYHKNKMKFCSHRDIKLMTIFECEWKNKRAIIESMIKSRLGLSIKVHGRSCSVSDIPSKEAYDFHTRNHISEGLKCSINIGLYDKKTGELLTVLSMVHSRFDKKYQYEIGRYSTKMGHTVVGGLGKMWKYFVENHNPVSCVTYSDLRFGYGRCYEKIGFNFVGETTPNYYYFKKGGDELESRMKYQKSKLIGMVGYDETKTEFDIMTENGYLRLYDCGNNKFEWFRAHL